MKCELCKTEVENLKEIVNPRYYFRKICVVCKAQLDDKYQELKDAAMSKLMEDFDRFAETLKKND